MNDIIRFNGEQYLKEEQKNGSILLVRYKNSKYELEDKLEWARKTLAKKNNYDFTVKFLYDGKNTYAIRYTYFDTEGVFTKAICNSNDDYYIEVGQAIAFCRLIGEDIPDFIFE